MTQRVSQLEIGGIAVELVRKRIRRLNLSVRGPQGKVRLSAPMRASDTDIRQFVESRRDWIHKHQHRLASCHFPSVYAYETGEMHPFSGRDYRLQIEPVSQPDVGVSLKGDAELQLRVPAGAGRPQRQAILEGWYRRQLKKRIPALISQYEPMMAVQVDDWRIRKMKTRWGTCNTHKRRIWINLELAKLPLASLEYVIVHEMAHLLERGHNARFYGLMDDFLPSWRNQAAFLRRYVIHYE